MDARCRQCGHIRVNEAPSWHTLSGNYAEDNFPAMGRVGENGLAEHRSKGYFGGTRIDKKEESEGLKVMGIIEMGKSGSIN